MNFRQARFPSQWGVILFSKILSKPVGGPVWYNAPALIKGIGLLWKTKYCEKLCFYKRKIEMPVKLGVGKTPESASKHN